MSSPQGPERWRETGAAESAGDLETRNGSGRAPAASGRGRINAEACHFVSAGAGRGPRPETGRLAGSPAAALRGLQRLGDSGAGEAGPRGQQGGGERPLGERRGWSREPSAAGPRGLVHGCMPPHASGWARPGRNSAPGARGRQEAERAGAGRAAWGWGEARVAPDVGPWG